MAIAKRKRRSVGEVVEVLWLADDSVTTDTYTSLRASTQLWDDGRALCKFTNGFDESGPVSAAHYTHVQRIIRRPIKKGNRS